MKIYQRLGHQLQERSSLEQIVYGNDHCLTKDQSPLVKPKLEIQIEDWTFQTWMKEKLEKLKSTIDKILIT